MWEQDIFMFPVEFAEQGNEWSYHLHAGLTGDTPIAGRGTDGTAAVELGPPVPGPVHCRLLVISHPDGISCTITGDGDSASPGQLTLAAGHVRSPGTNGAASDASRH